MPAASITTMPRLHLLTTLLLLLLHQAQASQWTVTVYAIELITTSVGRIATDLTFTQTSTVTLDRPLAATPTGSPLSSTADYRSVYDVSETTLYYPQTAVPASVLSELSRNATTTGIGDITLTNFYMDVVYTAPASCRSKFTFTTSTLVYVPTGAEDQVTPTSATTSMNRGDTFVTAYLSAGAVSTTSADTFISSLYLDRCTTPYALGRGGGVSGASRTASGYSYPTGLRSGGGDSSSSSYYGYDNCLGSLCPFWLIYIVVIIPILAFLIIGGLIESYYWFTRLMKGQFALRGVPLFWVAVSLWTLLCLRRKRSANPAVQPQLLKQWREMSTGTHIKLWLKYGFRHRDPPQLAAILGPAGQGAPPVPVWQSYPPQPWQGQQGGPGVGGPGGPPPGAPGDPQMQQSAPVYYPQPQQWQGAQVWAPQPDYPLSNSNQSQPNSQPVSMYYPPPPGQPGSPPPAPYGQGQPQPYVSPTDASRGSFPPDSTPSPAQSQPAGAVAGGAVGGVGGAAAAVGGGGGAGGQGHGGGQGHNAPTNGNGGYAPYSPPTEQQLQPPPQVVSAGHHGHSSGGGGDSGGGGGGSSSGGGGM